MCLALVIVGSTCSGFVRQASALDGKGNMSGPMVFGVQDTDGDGRYNGLWVNITFDVVVQDVFRFDLTVKNQLNTTTIISTENSTYLLMGVHTVPLIAPGFAIGLSGTDGPYTAYVEIYNQPFTLVGWQQALSPAYLAADFEEPPATAGTPYGDIPVDLDTPPDGLYNQLALKFPVDFIEAGTYVAVVVLMDAGMNQIAVIFQVTNVISGPYIFYMSFSGLDISANGVDGPYALMGVVLAIMPTGVIQVSVGVGVTGPYTAASFQTRITAPYTGLITDTGGNPIDGAQVILTNYTDLFQIATSTDVAGMYTVDAYMGDYTFVVDTGGYYADYAAYETLGLPPIAPSPVLRPGTPIDTTMQGTMVSPDELDLVSDGIATSGLAGLRLMVDWQFGNRDGVASSSEASLIMMMGGSLMFDDTDNAVYTDGIFYYPDDYANIVFTYDISGPIVSGGPGFVHQRVHLASNSTIPVAATHLIRCNLTYDGSGQASSTTITLPPGWIATGYDPVPSVTVSGIGSGVVVMDPLNNPNPGGIPDYVWVNITISDTTHPVPTVEGQAGVPNPQEFMQPVLISAWVNDTGPIATVTVDVVAPSSGPIGNFAMSYNAVSGKYEYALANYPDLGWYSFTIWATDIDGGIGRGSEAFKVSDTTNPVANAGPDQTTPPGGLVTLDGSSSTDNFGIDN